MSPIIDRATAPSSRSRTALRWLPTFVGYPLGGLAAELVVGPVDGLLAAVAGGAVTGAVLGTAQWLGLRRHGVPRRWIAVTAVGLAAGLGVGSTAVDYRTSLLALVAQGVASGAGVGLAQAAVLRRASRRLAAAWPVALAAAWAAGWAVTASVGVDVEAQYTVFGSTGALVVTALTAALAVWLADRSTLPAATTGRRPLSRRS